MPTLNEYADDDGYYILARPSDTGNITYQLKPRGEQIVEKVGYQDGEEIGWQVISALKVPNLVYTGDEGTTDDNISIDLGKEEIDALSEEDAKQLLDELSSVPRVGESQVDEIQEILDVSSNSEFDLDMLQDRINTRMRGTNMVGDNIFDGIDENGTVSMDFMMEKSDVRDENKIVRGDRFEADFVISLVGDISEGSEKDSIPTKNGIFFLRIYITQGYGIVSCDAEVEAVEISDKTMLKCQEIMTDMLSVVISEIESSGIKS